MSPTLRSACILLTLALTGIKARAQLPQQTAGDSEPRLTRAPAIVRRVEAIYPSAAKAAHLAGDVTLTVQIGEDGRVLEATVIQGAGHGFDEAALAAVKQFVFSPAEIDGQPASVQITYTEHFVYTQPPDVPPAVAAPVLPPLALRGRILERATRQPIFGAAVKVTGDKGPITPVLTDPNGCFELRLASKTMVIDVVELDHMPFHTQETRQNNEFLEVTYYLMPKSFGTFETVVRGVREKKEVTRRTLHREELESVPGSFGDPLRVVLDLPGMARTPYSIGGLIVRGASAADTGTYFDGVQLPLIFHFGGGPSVVNPEFLDRLDFFPGGFGGRYGRAIGGTLDIESRSPKNDMSHGSAKIDLIDAGVYLSAPVNDVLTVSLAARRSYIDAILGPILAAADNGITIVPSYYDYQARLTYHAKSSAHSFELFVLGSNDLLEAISSPAQGTPFQINASQGFQRISGSWGYHKNDLILKTMVFFGFDENSSGVGSSKIDSPATVGGMRQDFELALGRDLSLRGGVDAQLRNQGFKIASNQPFDYKPFPGSRPDVPLQQYAGNLNQLDIAEWLELEGKTAFGLKIIPSLRLDEFRADAAMQLAFGPRLIVRQALATSRPSALKASIGLYSEQPSALYANSLVGNPQLPLQRAMQASLGFEQRLTAALNLDATLFWSHRYHLSVPTNAVIQSANATAKPMHYNGHGIGDAYGLEVFVRHELSKHFFGWLAYTLSWSKQRDDLGQLWYATAYDQRHILTAIAQYKFGNGWAVGTRFRVVTGSPMTPVVDATYSADTQAYTPSYAAKNSGRQAIFHQLDLRVDKVWLFDRWQIGAYLDIQNIYDRQNADFSQYDYRYAGCRTIPDVPILPTLGVKGVF